MGYVFSIGLLAALIKVNSSEGHPKLYAGIYAGIQFFIGLLFGSLFGTNVLDLLIKAIICFIVAYAYFWLLDRFSDSSIWWLILFIGVIVLCIL